VTTTDAVTENVNQKALSSIEDSNAEESEDETLKGVIISMQDYDTLMEQLVDELQILVNNDKVSVKDHVEKSSILSAI
jgi:NADPH-dependent curcumin reductase CurA